MISAPASQKIKNMSIVCALLVVAIHVGLPDPSMRFTWFIEHLIWDGVARIAVPFFFLISGYFLALHMEEEGWYSREVKKRIRSLVIPYFVWMFLATFIVLPLPIIADYLAHRPFGYSPAFSSGRCLRMFGLDPRDGPIYLVSLWYIRCLFAFVLIAPAFKWLVKHGKSIWLGVAFLLTFIHSSFEPFPDFWQQCFDLGFSLSGVFYFSVGIHLGLRKHIQVSSYWGKISLLLGMLLILANTFFKYHEMTPRINLTTLGIPFLMYGIWDIISNKQWPLSLTASSFPLFILHRPLIPYVRLPIKYSPLGSSPFATLLIFLGATLLCLLVTLLLRKKYPRLNAFLFAGRS